MFARLGKMIYNEGMENIKVLKATRKHFDFLVKSNLIIHDISEQTYASKFAEQLEKDYFGKEKKFYCLVAEQDGVPVGMLLYSKMYWADDGEVLWVSQMYVEKHCRKFGVAQKLYFALKKENPDAKVISCATAKTNEVMNKVLKGLGFEIIDMNFYAKTIKK